MFMRTVLDLPLCLGVLKNRVLLLRDFMMDFCLCGAQMIHNYNLVVKYRFIFIKLALLQIKHIHLPFLYIIPKVINL